MAGSGPRDCEGAAGRDNIDSTDLASTVPIEFDCVEQAFTQEVRAMTAIIIGIIIILTFVGMVIYSIKGYNLVVGFFIMATLWTILALIGNAITPTAITVKDQTGWQNILGVLTNVYQTGPENYAKSILVNIFFGAFFGRVLMETGIAATLIRKVVELGGDRPRLTLVLLCIVTAVCFTSMTGIGPVISIAIIVMPILLALGIPSAIALFAFMGSIMAGILLNITNFKQYQGILGGLRGEFLDKYDFNQYFPFGITAAAIALVIVLVVANIALRGKIQKAWAMPVIEEATDTNAPWYSWLAVIMPVVLVITLHCPIILAFCLSAIYALLTCRKFRGGFTAVCRMIAKQFADGAIDVAPMIGFLLTLSMFNNAAVYAAPYFKAIIGGIFPTSAIALCILFAIIVPLGFFRGPTNLVGSGTAIAAIVVTMASAATGAPLWPITLLYPLFAIATIVPQHLDITQSWVAWGLGYAKVGSKDYMRYSIPTGWITGAILMLVILFWMGTRIAG